MIHQTKTLVTGSTDPYLNLAVEEYLLNGLLPDECIFYLWQNAKTVVIGRNQNAYKECRTDKLHADGGFLARRLSGGGSVYHDLGNLNFTFLANEADFDVARQLSVILRALEDYGIYAEKSGRNDISINERKFSGNAFYQHKERCYHHGTILVDVDMSKMNAYLQVSADKLRSHSVESVRSRVINLKELNPAIDIPSVRLSLLRAFEEIYGRAAIPLDIRELKQEEISVLREKYASAEWLYGERMQADYSFGRRFSWGEVEFLFRIRGESIADVRIFSDAMDAEVMGLFADNLRGVPFRAQAVHEAVSAAAEEAGPAMIADIHALINDQDIWKH
ncbi:MAG: lipoate--protein ligase [Clostridiales bacterium]|nr:lipoate--protein ligase [Clostridiales bacterium]